MILAHNSCAINHSPFLSELVDNCHMISDFTHFHYGSLMMWLDAMHGPDLKICQPHQGQIRLSICACAQGSVCCSISQQDPAPHPLQVHMLTGQRVRTTIGRSTAWPLRAESAS
jgi:hypothetical protein